MKIAPLNLINSISNINTPKRGVFTNPYVQKPDTFERSINFTGKQEEYKRTVEGLKKTGENAYVALKGQIASDGWAGKTADFVSGLWRSKNRAHIVEADIKTYNNQINELDKATKENKFESKFKELFDVTYNPQMIKEYNEKADNFKLAVTAKCLADVTNERLEEDLKIFKEHKGELKDRVITHYATNVAAGVALPLKSVFVKEKILEDIEKGLINILGGKERLEAVSKKNGVDLSKASDEKKYKAYGAIAEFLIETSKSTAKRCRGDKTLEDLKEEYENAYRRAYGMKNDIQERVDKYSRSQEIGSAVVRGIVRSGLVAATIATAGVGGIAGIGVGSAATFGAKMLAEVTDKMTNDIDDSIDLSPEILKKMAKSSMISAAEYITTRSLKTIIPSFDTSSEALDGLLNTAKGALIDVSTGMVGEFFKQNEWNTKQIIPRTVISLVFSKLGKDNPITYELMSLTKGGVNQAMKKKHRDYDAVREFVQGTKIALDECYSTEPHKYADLKAMSLKHPEKFEEYMVACLQAEIDEKTMKK